MQLFHRFLSASASPSDVEDQLDLNKLAALHAHHVLGDSHQATHLAACFWCVRCPLARSAVWDVRPLKSSVVSRRVLHMRPSN